MLGAPLPAMADEARDRQWHLRALKINEVHQISRGAGVTVAVVDTGVNAEHRDLTGNVLPGLDLTGEDTQGLRDTQGHGTAMAGLIAAHGHGPGNTDGALGIAPQAKILPIRNAQAKVSRGGNLHTAINEAVARGAKVVSLSVSGGTTTALKEAVERALAADVVLVAASGNTTDADRIIYPARYPGVLAVGALGRDGRLDPITVTGAEMGITAPGADIASTSRSGIYLTSTGTSNATAIVAGAAALVRSKFPDLSATEVVHRLTATADDKGAPGRDPEYGYGSLNLVKALTADVQPAPAEPTPSAAPPTSQVPSEPAAAPLPDGGTGVTLSPLAYVLGGLCLLVVLVGVGLVVWLVARSRRRRGPPPVPAGYPPPGGGGPVGYPAPSYPPTSGYPPPGYGPPGQAGPPTHPGPPYQGR
ncbi:type VII secretion-associated serine protease mycosin [Plantactinospora sp. B5E13]|uniref:type VII secretion-associated serine protease mycosin n=1 Tax=unclassified Plantactinospora TaxID=2631981 RepID=UPI00325E4226